MVIHGGYMDNHSNVTWQGDTVVISGGIVEFVNAVKLTLVYMDDKGV